MKIFIPWIQENDWETEPFNLGAYSSQEKAEEAILQALRENEYVLTLEIYESQDEPQYIFGVQKFILDK